MSDTIEYKGYTITIEQDDCNDINPRKDFDHTAKMVCFHNRYNLGDETSLRSSSFDGWDDLYNYLQSEEGAAIILPLYLYDHSGITIYTGREGKYLQWEGFDSGQVGFIYLDRSTILKEWGYKYITKARRQKLIEYMQSEVNEYDMYLRGEVYWYKIESPEGDDLDSCGGFYGYDFCKDEAKSQVDYYVEHTN